MSCFISYCVFCYLAANENSDEDDGPDISDVLGTNLSIGEHAFSKMEADVDKQRMQNRQSETTAGNTEQQRIRHVVLFLSYTFIFLDLCNLKVILR